MNRNFIKNCQNSCTTTDTKTAFVGDEIEIHRFLGKIPYLVAARFKNGYDLRKYYSGEATYKNCNV